MTEVNQQLLAELADFFAKAAAETSKEPEDSAGQRSCSWQLLGSAESEQNRVIKPLVAQLVTLLAPIYGQPEVRSEDRSGWQYLWWRTSTGQYLHSVAKVKQGVTLWALQPQETGEPLIHMPVDYLEKLCLGLFALPWPINAVTLVRFVRSHGLVALDECFAHYYLPQTGALGNEEQKPHELLRTHRENNLLPAALQPPQLTFELQGDYPRGACLRWECPQAELVARELEARLQQKLVPLTLFWSVTAGENQLEIKVLKELTSPDWERIRANRYSPRQALGIVENLVAAEKPLDYQQMQAIARAVDWEQVSDGECENYVTKRSSLGFPGAHVKYQAGRVAQVMFTYGASVYEEHTGISSVQAPLLEAFTFAFGNPTVRKEYREYDFFYGGKQYFKRGHSTIYSFGTADGAKRVSLVVFPQLEIVVDFALAPASTLKGEADQFSKFTDLPVKPTWVDALVVAGVVTVVAAGLLFLLS
ncbi:MAG: hypothetical protein Q4D73_07780 [Actinomycetaceae bacterium]|nr:hypothetical protein [Actinomycetaceae bacterium]